MIFNIAGLKINYEGENEVFLNKCSRFHWNNEVNNSELDMTIKMSYLDQIFIPHGEMIVDDAVSWKRKALPDKGYCVYSKTDHENEAHILMEANEDWRHVTIYSSSSTFVQNNIVWDKQIYWKEYNQFLFSGIAIRNRLIHRNAVQIHSSSIDYNGKGLIFSAPSGTGKSTHTKLWQELYKDQVTIVNDDRPAIRIIDGQTMLCGIPWSGSTEIYSNRIIPLACIIMLERGNINGIERVNNLSALQLLMPRCFSPYFDADMMELTMSTIERIIVEVPVYRLKCKPDFEAVELVRRCIM